MTNRLPENVPPGCFSEGFTKTLHPERQGVHRREESKKESKKGKEKTADGLTKDAGVGERGITLKDIAGLFIDGGLIENNPISSVA